MTDLALNPLGHLVFIAGDDAFSGQSAAEALTATGLISDEVEQAFRESIPAGLLQLASLRREAALPPAFAFWRRFGEQYLTSLCHTPEPEENLKSPLAPPLEKFNELIDSAPPMAGGEYLSRDSLEKLWRELDLHARAAISACLGGLAAWLKERNPLWHRVGRVCFHLAENKRDAECPFAFMATYAPRLVDGTRVQYLPLGKALAEYAGDKNQPALIKLLTPVQQAAEKCGWVKELSDSGRIFHPLRWTAEEAYRFLRDIPALEESGLLARVPDWWAKRPPRVMASIAIGGKPQSHFGVDSLLDFKLSLSLGGEELSEVEWAEILANSGGLVRIKGRWAEVDKEKLQAALDHWRKVAKEAGDGVSFIEGMRLLAGAPLDARLSGIFDNEATTWAEVHAGSWLEGRLRELRHPESAKALPGLKELRATLRPYQAEGVRWLWFLSKLGLGACLADDMGLGKTVQVLALLLQLKHEQKESGKAQAPALVILPASLLANWRDELERFAPTLVAKFAHPSQISPDELKSAQAAPKKFLRDADVVFTTYGMLARWEWLAGAEWGLAVLDEAQAIKNPASKQTRAVKAVKSASRIALTGTPVENSLADLWSIFDFLTPGLLGQAKAFGSFVKKLEKREAGQYTPLRKLVSPYILRRLKTDKAVISDLPDKTEVKAFCGLARKQAAIYAESVLELQNSLSGLSGMARRGLILSFIMRFKQICNHPDQYLGTGDYHHTDSGKFARLREICEEIAARQEKALIFTQFREITAPLAAFLRGVFGRPGLVLHGEVAVKKRKELVDEFQRDGGPPFFVLSLKAGGTGLNLTAASHVIHFDRWWNPAVENQATDRAFRIGQKRNVLVHKFVCQGTVEEKIDTLIAGKTALAGEILEGGAPSLVTEMSDNELLNFVRLDMNAMAE